MLTFATVGTSQITEVFADAVSRVPDVQIGTAYSRDAARAAAFAEKIGAPASASDWAGLLADEAVDAIYVASPNRVHASQAAQALAAGKHVLVEKPAVTEVADWDELVALSKRHGVVLLEAIRNRFDPGLAKVRDLLPEVGTLRRLTLRYEKRSSRYDQVLAGETPNIFNPELGGGALRDLGIYCISALIALVGEPESVVAASVPLRTGADGLGTLLASYPGFLADLHYSKITSPDQPSVVQGEDGTLVIDAIDAPRTLTLARTGAAPSTITIEGPANPMESEVHRFATLVAAGDTADADQAATRAALGLIAAAS